MTIPDTQSESSAASREPAYWAVVPAAGVGVRMGADLPKQYLQLAGKTVIEHSLSRLLQLPMLKGVMVAVSREDVFWQELAVFADPRIRVAEGGAERADSVQNALRALADDARPGDWVLVHDAARPCVRREDLQKLVSTLADHAIGGILGAPVHDTLKRVGEAGAIETTQSRAALWRAFTPQMFRHGMLLQALTNATARGLAVTDESSAMEAAGYLPQMVEGHSDNIKITTPEDLRLADMLLRQIEE